MLWDGKKGEMLNKLIRFPTSWDPFQNFLIIGTTTRLGHNNQLICMYVVRYLSRIFKQWSSDLEKKQLRYKAALPDNASKMLRIYNFFAYYNFTEQICRDKKTSQLCTQFDEKDTEKNMELCRFRLKKEGKRHVVTLKQRIKREE